MQIFWISVIVALSDSFLTFSTIPFFTVPSAPTTTGITMVFICHILCISSSRSLYLHFFSVSFSAMFLSDGTVISISLQVEFTKSLTMISGLFAVIVLSVLTGMSHMMVMLLSLLCITVSGSCSYHLSVISISWSLHMLQWRYAAALLCLEMYSVLVSTSHPDTIWSTVSSCCEHNLHLLSTCWPHITFW